MRLAEALAFDTKILQKVTTFYMNTVFLYCNLNSAYLLAVQVTIKLLGLSVSCSELLAIMTGQGQPLA